MVFGAVVFGRYVLMKLLASELDEYERECLPKGVT